MILVSLRCQYVVLCARYNFEPWGSFVGPLGFWRLTHGEIVFAKRCVANADTVTVVFTAERPSKKSSVPHEI